MLLIASCYRNRRQLSAGLMGHLALVHVYADSTLNYGPLVVQYDNYDTVRR